MKDLLEVLETKSVFIFDMDGTLVNLEELNISVFQSILKRDYDYELDNLTYQELFSGKPSNQGFSDFLHMQQIKDVDVDMIVENYRKQKRVELENHIDDVVHLIHGADVYLRILREEGCRISLATSAYREFAELILKHFDLWKYFEYTLTADDVERGKPDPEVYIKSLKMLGLDMLDAVVFEDSRNGIKSAMSAGVYTVGIHTKGLNDSFVNMADYVIEDYMGLLG